MYSKLIIPAILAATVLVAGSFAFMQVEKATTVHAGIQSTQLTNMKTVADDDLSSKATFSCNLGDFLVHYVITNTTPAGGDEIDIDLDDGTGADLVFDVDNKIDIVSGTIQGEAEKTVSFLGDNEDMEGLFTIQCQSQATITTTP